MIKNRYALSIAYGTINNYCGSFDTMAQITAGVIGQTLSTFDLSNEETVLITVVDTEENMVCFSKVIDMSIVRSFDDEIHTK
jgi:hypothetical protein